MRDAGKSVFPVLFLPNKKMINRFSFSDKTFLNAWLFSETMILATMWRWYIAITNADCGNLDRSFFLDETFSNASLFNKMGSSTIWLRLVIFHQVYFQYLFSDKVPFWIDYRFREALFPMLEMPNKATWLHFVLFYLLTFQCSFSERVPFWINLYFC